MSTGPPKDVSIMKKLLPLLALCLPLAMFTQCQKKLVNQYTIDATVEGDATQALLSYPMGDDTVTDTVSVVDNAFAFKGTADEPTPATLIVNFAGDDDSRPRIFHTMVILEPGMIAVHIPQNWGDTRVTGTVTNDEITHWNDTIRPLQKEAEEINAWFESLTPEQQQENILESQARYQKLEDRLKVMAEEYVAGHPDSWFALNSLFGTVVDNHNPELGQKVLDGFTERVRSTKLGRERQERVDAWRATSVGSVAPDFSQTDPEGNEVKLSDLRGKWVLIDFWASWCAPCRGENPNVVAVYNEFKDLGFTILGVSLDSNKDAWLKAIEDDQLHWTQVSDLQGWGNAVAEVYAIRNIPANFLLDPQGVIIAKNLRGDKLREVVAMHLTPDIAE